MDLILASFIFANINIDLTPIPLKEPSVYVQETLDYALPSIIGFVSTAIGFKILVSFINSAKAD